MCQQWWFYCASHWGWETPLSKHVYCVAVTFKMTEQVQQWICIKFCVMLEHSSMETIHMIQKTAATRNWWLAVLSQQCARSCIASRAVFWQNTKSSKWCSPLQPRFGVLWLLAFPQTKITFKREDASDYWWDSGKYDGAAGGDWENGMRSQGAYFEENWGIIVLCTIFLISSSVGFYIFPITWLDTFLTGYMHIYLHISLLVYISLVYIFVKSPKDQCLLGPVSSVRQVRWNPGHTQIYWGSGYTVYHPHYSERSWELGDPFPSYDTVPRYGFWWESVSSFSISFDVVGLTLSWSVGAFLLASFSVSHKGNRPVHCCWMGMLGWMGGKESPAEVSNLLPTGHLWPRMAMNVAQHKIVNLLQTSFLLINFINVCVFNVWPKTTLLPAWPRDAKSLDTPGPGFLIPARCWCTST